jgi:hypothetical protein
MIESLLYHPSRETIYGGWLQHDRKDWFKSRQLILQIPNQLFFSALKTGFSAPEIYVGIIQVLKILLMYKVDLV